MAEASKRKGEKSLKEAEMPPLPFADKILEVKPDPGKGVATLSEARQKIESMQKFCDEIQDKLGEVYRVTGMSPKILEAFINNPSNFSASEWERVKKEQKQMMAAIMLPQDLQKLEELSKKPSTSLQNLPDDPKLAKDHRKKSAAMRRNWLRVP